MKAIKVSRFGGPEVLELVEVDDLRPTGDQILVRVEAAGVNPVETYIRSGQYGRLPSLPYTPGSDGAGTVVATGERVYLTGSLTGTYAEYCLAKPSQVQPLPDRLGFQEGAALGGPYTTAYHGLFHKADVQPGQRVLVRGASGSVGQAAVQLATAHGCRVVGTASEEQGRALVLKAGAEEVCGHDETEGPFDAILEMHANTGLQRDLEECVSRGTVVIIGSRGRIEIDPRLTMSGDLTVRGLSVANASAEELAAVNRGMALYLEEGSVVPVVRSAHLLKDAATAHQEVMERGAAGKIVLVTFGHS